MMEATTEKEDMIYQNPPPVGLDRAFHVTISCRFGGAVHDNALSFVCNNGNKLGLSDDKYEAYTLISTPRYAAKNKVPQENIPDRVRTNVSANSKGEGLRRAGWRGENHCTLKKRMNFISSKRVPQTLDNNEDDDGIHDHVAASHLQLWGAAQPGNIYAGGPCALDPTTNVGVCGDWMVAPSVEGAALSGLVLADAIADSMKNSPGERKGMGMLDLWRKTSSSQRHHRNNQNRGEGASERKEGNDNSGAFLPFSALLSSDSSKQENNSGDAYPSSPVGAFGPEWAPILEKAAYYSQWQTHDAVEEILAASQDLEEKKKKKKKKRNTKRMEYAKKPNARSGRGGEGGRGKNDSSGGSTWL
eukprot:jgi/Bigna1/125439/aug1.1_g147